MDDLKSGAIVYFYSNYIFQEVAGCSEVSLKRLFGHKVVFPSKRQQAKICLCVS